MSPAKKNGAPYLFVLALLALLMAVWFYKWGRVRNIAPSVQSGRVEQTKAVSVTPSERASLLVSHPSPPPNAASQEKPHTADPRATEKWRIAAEENNLPIDFWGRVIDQNGAPLGAVKVFASARAYAVDNAGSGLTYAPRAGAQSGTDGLFEIRGLRGDSLKLEALEKDGYEAEAGTLRVFSCDASQGSPQDSNNPAIFRLWAKGLQQTLITGDRVFRFIPDGRKYALNLGNGTLNEVTNSEGDLQFWVKRPSTATRGQPYDWTFGVRTQAGIVQEANAQYSAMTLAPGVGYKETYESDHHASEEGWAAGEWQDRFYVKTAAHGFGRVQVTVDSFYDVSTGQGRLHIEYAINPAGSPILR